MYSSSMRTTIEMPDEIRAKLLEISARRGTKGFSHLVREALESFLADLDSENERVRRAVLLKGAFHEKDATGMRDAVRGLRSAG